MTATLVPLEVEEFLTWLSAERGRSPNTLAAYRRDLRAYSGWLDSHAFALAEVEPTTVEQYVRHLRDAGLAPASVVRALVAVRSLHRFLAEESVSTGDPTLTVDLPRVPRGLPKALSESEVEALLDGVQGDQPRQRRDRAVLEVLYGTGMRISELVGLTLSTVDLGAGMARVMGKGSKERIVPMVGLARVAMAAWLSPLGRDALAPERWARRGDAEAVFLNARGGRLSRQGAWGVVHAYGQRVGLAERLTPHVLRHSCATHMLDHGADIRVVQELLGHASISTTQIYTKVSTERIRQVFEAAHPRALLGAPEH